jgi:hypothetical protein
MTAITRETLEFFNSLLDQVQLPASAANFEEQASQIIRVRHELREALGDALDDHHDGHLPRDVRRGEVRGYRPAERLGDQRPDPG